MNRRFDRHQKTCLYLSNIVVCCLLTYRNKEMGRWWIKRWKLLVFNWPSTTTPNKLLFNRSKLLFNRRCCKLLLNRWCCKLTSIVYKEVTFDIFQTRKYSLTSRPKSELCILFVRCNGILFLIENRVNIQQ